MAGRHRLYEESIGASVYATDRGTFRRLNGRLVGRTFRRVEVGDYWSASDDQPADDGLDGWRELVEAAAAARRARGL